MKKLTDKEIEEINEVERERNAANSAYDAFLHQSFSFKLLLEKAVTDGVCMMCGGFHPIRRWGVCLECAQFIKKELLDEAERNFFVEVKVKVYRETDRFPLGK